MKPDLTVTDRWGLRAEWSAFLEAHTARRLAASSSEQDPAVPISRGPRQSPAGGPASKSTRRARAGKSKRAGD